MDREHTEDTAPPRRIGAGKKILFALVLTVAPLALVELGVRLVLGTPADAPLLIPAAPTEGAPTQWKTSELHMADPYLIWRNRPGIDIEYKGVRVRTNRFGMRDRPVSRRKPPGEYRILSLGESTTFGSKVEQDRTYSALLEGCLNERGSPARFRVLNAGTPGWTLAQSYEYLRREGLDFEPDAVLLYHGFNDFLKTTMTRRRTRPGEPGAEGLADLANLEERERRGDSLGSWLSRHCMTVRWLVHALRPAAAPTMAGGEGGGTGADAGVRVPEGDRREILRRLGDLTRERGVELVVLIPCYRAFTKHRKVLLDFVRESGVACIDLEETVEGLGKDRSSLYFDGAHPRPEVHAAYAERICRYFLEEILSRRRD